MNTRVSFGKTKGTPGYTWSGEELQLRNSKAKWGRGGSAGPRLSVTSCSLPGWGETQGVAGVRVEPESIYL